MKKRVQSRPSKAAREMYSQNTKHTGRPSSLSSGARVTLHGYDMIFELVSVSVASAIKFEADLLNSFIINTFYKASS